jgi:hypothetical protein
MRSSLCLKLFFPDFDAAIFIPPPLYEYAGFFFATLFCGGPWFILNQNFNASLSELFRVSHSIFTWRA